jgi:hypothetical protein
VGRKQIVAASKGCGAEHMPRMITQRVTDTARRMVTIVVEQNFFGTQKIPPVCDDDLG